MESTIETINDVVVFTAKYESLDAKNATSFRGELAAATADGSQVLLDLREVKFVDSAGLGAIVASLKRLRASGGDMEICGAQKPVLTLFELVRMHHLVNLHNDREAVLGAGV